jgi:hypothetical protein
MVGWGYFFRSLKATAIHKKTAKSEIFVADFVAENKKAPDNQGLYLFVGGPDGTRTRDPMRDRHVF